MTYGATPLVRSTDTSAVICNHFSSFFFSPFHYSVSISIQFRRAPPSTPTDWKGNDCGRKRHLPPPSNYPPVLIATAAVVVSLVT